MMPDTVAVSLHTVSGVFPGDSVLSTEDVDNNNGCITFCPRGAVAIDDSCRSPDTSGALSQSISLQTAVVVHPRHVESPLTETQTARVVHPAPRGSPLTEHGVLASASLSESIVRRPLVAASRSSFTWHPDDASLPCRRLSIAEDSGIRQNMSVTRRRLSIAEDFGIGQNVSVTPTDCIIPMSLSDDARHSLGCAPW